MCGSVHSDDVFTKSPTHQSGRFVGCWILVGRRTMFIPERVDTDALLRVSFSGPSVTMLPSGRLHCGRAADAALQASRREAAAASRDGDEPRST